MGTVMGQWVSPIGRGSNMVVGSLTNASRWISR